MTEHHANTGARTPNLSIKSHTHTHTHTHRLWSNYSIGQQLPPDYSASSLSGVMCRIEDLAHSLIVPAWVCMAALCAEVWTGVPHDFYASRDPCSEVT